MSTIFVPERPKDSRSKSHKVVNRSDKSNDNNNRYRNKKKTSVENLVGETEGRVQTWTREKETKDGKRIHVHRHSLSLIGTTIGWKNGTRAGWLHGVVVEGWLARDGWRGWYLPSPRALTGRYSNNTGKHREINMASVALFPLVSPCLSSSRSLASSSSFLSFWHSSTLFPSLSWLLSRAQRGRVNPLWGGVTPGQSPTIRREKLERRESKKGACALLRPPDGSRSSAREPRHPVYVVKPVRGTRHYGRTESNVRNNYASVTYVEITLLQMTRVDMSITIRGSACWNKYRKSPRYLVN